jgi:hypothetical protein
MLSGYVQNTTLSATVGNPTVHNDMNLAQMLPEEHRKWQIARELCTFELPELLENLLI